MKQYIVIFCLGLLFILTLGDPGYSGSRKAVKTVTLEDAKRMALSGNHEYKIAVLQLHQAKERVNQVWGELVPVLESEASLSRQSAENGFMSLSDGQYDIKFIQLRFGLNPGIFYNSLQVSRDSYTIALEEVRRIKRDIEYKVIKNYFDLLLAHEIITMHRDSVIALKANLQDVENLYRTGSVPKYDLLQAQVQLKNREPLLLEAGNNYNTLLDSFNFVLGETENYYCADKAVLHREHYSVPGGDKDSVVQYFSTIALANRPEIMQLKKRRELANHAKNIEDSYYLWPTFSVSGYYGMTRYQPNEVDLGLAAGSSSPDFSQITGDSSWQNTWQVRVAATYRWGSLLPVERSRARQREQAVKIREAEQELDRLKRLVVISIRSQVAKLYTASDMIVSQRDNVKTAQEGLRIARESYKAGVIKNSELLAAELSLTNARTGYINAVHDYYISLAALEKEMGITDTGVIMKGVK